MTLHFITLHCTALQYTTVQYSTIQYNTIPENTIQYSTLPGFTLPHFSLHHNTLHQITTLHYKTTYMHGFTSTDTHTPQSARNPIEALRKRTLQFERSHKTNTRGNAHAHEGPQLTARDTIATAGHPAAYLRAHATLIHARRRAPRSRATSRGTPAHTSAPDTRERAHRRDPGTHSSCTAAGVYAPKATC